MSLSRTAGFIVFAFSMATAYSPAAAQVTSTPERPLAGFQYMHIQTPVANGGARDPMSLKPYLESRLAGQSWKFVSSDEMTRIVKDSRLAGMTLDCQIGWGPSGGGSYAVLVCADVLGQELFAIRETGYSGYTVKGDIEAALRDIAANLKRRRPTFNANLAVPLDRMLPSVDTVQVTESAIDDRIARGMLANEVEGVWSSQDQLYRFAILRSASDGEYVASVLKSDLSYWQPGMVKGQFTATAVPRTFLVRWRDAARKPVNGRATISGANLTLTLGDGSSAQTVTLLRLKPSGPSTVASDPPATTPRPSGARTPVGTGTGFVVGRGLIATNHHVIRGASSYELFSPDLKQSFQLDVVVSDPINDLAVLRVQTATPLEPFLRLADSVDVRLGEDIVVVGFPLGPVLGATHKVTTGVVSGLDGLAGDPRMFQLTAPIQPGSSGSPVFSSSGAVVGIVTSTLDALESLKSDGSIPQNVNFAIKADYLKLLLRRASAATLSDKPVSTGTAKSTATLVQQVQSAIVQIRSYK